MPVYLEVDSIVPNDYNPNNMSLEVFQSLLKDAKENGAEALDPILVRPLDFAGGKQRYEIIDGENRWKVVKQIGWQRIRATIKKVSLDEAKAINYRKNRERGSMDPFKEALLFQSEVDKGKTYDQIGEKYGISHAQVGARLSLLNISEETREIVTRVTNPTITTSHLELVATVDDPKKQRMLIENIVNDDLSVKQAHRLRIELLRPDFPLQKDFPPTPSEENFTCPCGRIYSIVWSEKVVLPSEEDRES